MQEWCALHPDLYGWVVLPLLIFVARIMDVSIGTSRVIFVSRGYRVLAAVAGFWEVLIWLLAIGQIMQNLDNPMCYLAYAGGFAMGNYIGITLTNKMSLGVVLVRVMTVENTDQLIESLKRSQYGVTAVEGRGAFGPMKMVFTIVNKQDLPRVIQIIQAYNPNAFYSVEEVDQVSQGKLGPRKFPGGLNLTQLFRPFRKGK
ncbi:MAG: DUF2179 domain-containing protein [Planctomycetes bacterium]|nr:DUF2179 domain-containing protein [Planctomycetota bacterium]